jgi:hypothetical protein
MKTEPRKITMTPTAAKMFEFIKRNSYCSSAGYQEWKDAFRTYCLAEWKKREGSR